MVVQHNITAMNSSRQLGIVTGQQAKQSEKLASGYKINRAGDDAAGLKISEKMRSQIRGLQKASTNAQDGVSLIQTAEGALNEAHSILQRMNELAVQGANDTNESIDRDAINEELTALTTELNRISDTTQFNKQNLLDGTFTGKNLQVGANANQNIAISIDDMDAAALGLTNITYLEAADPLEGDKPTVVTYKGMTYNYDLTKTASANMAAAATQFKGQVAGLFTDDMYVGKLEASGSYTYTSGNNTKCGSVASAKAVDISAMKKDISTNMTAANLKKYATIEDATAKQANAYKSTDSTLGAPSVSSYAAANATITAVQEAINKVSSQRSALGALQNRLEHTIANLDNVAENTQAAESRIRDTDMAAEMVEYSKNNILAQAGQSMLAQANQSKQGVLSLLQ